MAAALPPLLLYSHPETGELLRRRWMLLVIDGSDRGTVTEISHTPALVGAAPASTLVITDDTVSRYHVEIDVTAEGLRIRDLDSTNGTYVDDRRIRDAFIEDQQEFRAGRTMIRAIAEDEPAASEIDTDPRGVPPGAVETLGRALGVAGSTRELLRLVRKIAPSSSPVMFIGESGTGKATLARLLHDLSPRKDQPFVSLSPRAAGDALEVETRLFGRPSKNGVPARPGLFEVAKGGTLFIEGIEHLPSSLHASLLRTIESSEIQRPGDDRKLRVDVRLVSSSSRGLGDDAAFDPTLARRAAVVRLVVPPLRERSEDIPALAELFLTQLSGRELAFGSSSITFLRSLPFPENLDHLRRLISAILPETKTEDLLGPEDQELAHRLEIAFVTDHVTKRRGHVSRAAAELGFAPKTLFRFLSLHHVDLDAM